jgi:hypothetical protein
MLRQRRPLIRGCVLAGGLEVATFRPSPSRQNNLFIVPLHPWLPRVRRCLNCARDPGWSTRPDTTKLPMGQDLMVDVSSLIGLSLMGPIPLYFPIFPASLWYLPPQPRFKRENVCGLTLLEFLLVLD